MKKIICLSTFLIVGSVLMVSCQKTEVAEELVEELDVMTHRAEKLRKLIYIPIHSDYPPFDVVAEIVDCTSLLPGNCFPDVIVTGMTEVQQEVYEKFIDYVDIDDVSAFFHGEEYLELFPDLKLLPDVLQGLREGEIKFVKEKGAEEGAIYYVGVPVELENEGAYLESDVLCAFSFKSN